MYSCLGCRVVKLYFVKSLPEHWKIKGFVKNYEYILQPNITEYLHCMFNEFFNSF